MEQHRLIAFDLTSRKVGYFTRDGKLHTFPLKVETVVLVSFNEINTIATSLTTNEGKPLSKEAYSVISIVAVQHRVESGSVRDAKLKMTRVHVLFEDRQ